MVRPTNAAWSERPGCRLRWTRRRDALSTVVARMSRRRLPWGPRCVHPCTGMARSPNPSIHRSIAVARLA
eukprot:3965363-Lingulodinium_polyedra.AAC.1